MIVRARKVLPEAERGKDSGNLGSAEKEELEDRRKILNVWSQRYPLNICKLSQRADLPQVALIMGTGQYYSMTIMFRLRNMRVFSSSSIQLLMGAVFTEFLVGLAVMKAVSLGWV